MISKRFTWFSVAMAGALALLVLVAWLLHTQPGAPPPPLDARQAFRAALDQVRARALRDARAATAAGRFGFHGGSFEQRDIEGRFPGFDTCRIPGAFTVTDLVGLDDRKEALRAVYGEVYNLEILRLHPGALAENCAPARRGEHPPRPLGETETRYAELLRQSRPPETVDYYVCSAERPVGEGMIQASLMVHPDGRPNWIEASWSSRDSRAPSQDPLLVARWGAEAEAPGWIGAGSVGLSWEGFPPLGPSGAKAGLSFRDSAGRPIALPIRDAYFSEHSLNVGLPWADLRRATGTDSLHALLRAPDGREVRAYLIPAGTLDYVAQRLREAVAMATAKSGDLRQCDHVTGS